MPKQDIPSTVAHDPKNGFVDMTVRASDTRTLKKCPKCNATRFQGPVQRGEIRDGQFVPVQTLFECVHCHFVAELDELLDWVVPIN